MKHSAKMLIDRFFLCRHWYTDPDSMFNGRYTFDSMSVAHDARVFASEYAVFDWGIKTIPRGNIQVLCAFLCRLACRAAESFTPCSRSLLNAFEIFEERHEWGGCPGQDDLHVGAVQLLGVRLICFVPQLA